MIDPSEWTWTQFSMKKSYHGSPTRARFEAPDDMLRRLAIDQSEHRHAVRDDSKRETKRDWFPSFSRPPLHSPRHWSETKTTNKNKNKEMKQPLDDSCYMTDSFGIATMDFRELYPNILMPYHQESTSPWGLLGACDSIRPLCRRVMGMTPEDRAWSLTSTQHQYIARHLSWVVWASGSSVPVPSWAKNQRLDRVACLRSVLRAVLREDSQENVETILTRQKLMVANADIRRLHNTNVTIRGRLRAAQLSADRQTQLANRHKERVVNLEAAAMRRKVRCAAYLEEIKTQKATMESLEAQLMTYEGEELDELSDSELKNALKTIMNAQHKISHELGRRKERKAKEVKNVCVVCMDAPTAVAFVPCGHHCVCEECCKKIVSGTHKCPVCRDVFSLTCRIFT